ncbi:MAG: hypothetical protein A2133_11315, partial [Actinobacteria bacterium RBG_16_64_13]
MRRLRILHVIGGGDTGGAMSHLLPLLSALERAGCEVHLACLGEGGLADQAERRGLSVVRLDMSSPRDLRVLAPLRRLISAGSPAAHAPARRWDVVHAHGMRANLPVRLVTRGMRRPFCIFTTVHSDLRLDYDSARLAGVYQGLDRATLSWVDEVICVSASLRDLLIERGYPVERLTSVHSGLETATPAVAGTSVVAPASTSGVAEAGATAANSPTARVGTIARLVAVKDIDLMLEVGGRLRRTHPRMQMVIVGDGPERERLERVSAVAGLAGVVRFTGRLDDVGAVLRELDVYLTTSLFEGGVSMSVLEAMAAGVPVVTTDAGGVAEAVVDGETGYVVRRDLERGALA